MDDGRLPDATLCVLPNKQTNIQCYSITFNIFEWIEHPFSALISYNHKYSSLEKLGEDYNLHTFHISHGK